MKKQLLFPVALSLLSGCASSNLYWGPALLTYGSGHAETFASGGSRSGAEYDTARKKLKRSHPETTRGQTSKNTEEQVIEEVTVGASSKIGIP